MSNDNKKIRVAFIKFGGLASGGTEKLVQSLAANLDHEKFEVDYFWCHGAPYLGADFVFTPTDKGRLAYMEASSVTLIEFKVAYKDVRDPVHPWVDTNFWEKFDEKNYDIVVTGRAGHSEYPFHKIIETPIVDIICLANHVDKQFNIVKSVHISEWQKNVWVKAGGDPAIATVIPIFDELLPPSTEDLRESLGIAKETFVYGFHQRAEPTIFSSVPLDAYATIEQEFGDKVVFVLLGGSDLHREQATQLGLKNVKFLDHTGESETIGKFLRTLDVYAHGRKDGETAGLAIIEAMQYGLPVVSHLAAANGHVETIGNAGKVCSTMGEYITELKDLIIYDQKRTRLSDNSLARYEACFDFKASIRKYEQIFEEVNNKLANKEYLFATVKATDDWLEEWIA